MTQEADSSFRIEGWTYYQQGRRCSKARCQCKDGHLHGPYWYKRNHRTKQVTYLGKALPQDIAAAKLAHDRMLSQMAQTRRELLAQYDAMTRLMLNEDLSENDREHAQALGFLSAMTRSAHMRARGASPKKGPMVCECGQQAVEGAFLCEHCLAKKL